MNDLEKALGLLPHGPEFRFLDRLTALDGGKAGEGEYWVRGDEPFLRGHFPGDSQGELKRCSARITAHAQSARPPNVFRDLARTT